jgi:hypothetical protein
MVFKDRTKGERDNRNTGQRDWKNGETVKRRSEGKRQRVASSEWRIVFWRAVFLHCRKISAHQEMRPPVKIHFTSRQLPVAAIYALRITLYDTNLFGAYAPPTNYSLIAIR